MKFSKILNLTLLAILVITAFSNFDRENVELVNILGEGLVEALVIDDYLYTVQKSVLKVSNVTERGIETIGSCIIEDYVYEIYKQDSLVYAVGTTGIYIINVSDPVSPEEVCFFSCPFDYPQIDVDSCYIFATDYYLGTFIYDCSDLDDIREIASVPTDRGTRKVEVYDDVMFVSISGLLKAFDISDITSPVEIMNYSTGSNIYSIHLEDTILYICSYSDIQILDVSDYSSPTLVSSIEEGIFYKMLFSDNKLITSKRYGVCDVYDVSDPYVPILLYAREFDGGSVWEFSCDSNRVFAAAQKSINILENFRDTSATMTYYDFGDYSYESAISNNYLFTASGYSGSNIYDISNPYDVIYVTTISERNKFTQRVHVSDNRLIIHRNGLRIFDKSDLSNIRFLGEYGDYAGYSRYNMASNNEFLYLSSEYCLLKVLDIRIPAYTNCLCYFDTELESYGIELRDSVAFIAASYDGLKIVNVSDPYEPYVIGSYDTYGQARNIAVRGNYAYVTENNEGLRIFDISDYSAPYSVGMCWLEDSVISVAVNDNYAFVANDIHGLKVIDISDPSSPFEAGHFDTPSIALDVSISGNFAYVTDYEAGIFQLDVTMFTESISEPSLPPLSNLPENMSLCAYPNPFNSAVSIELPNEACDIKIYDINGKLCHNASIANGTTYSWHPAQELEIGIYNVIVKSNNIEHTSRVVYIK